MVDQNISTPEGKSSPPCSGLQLWEPYNALQCCEPDQTTLQVTPSENLQEKSLPQLYYSQVQKEVLPARRSLQLPEPRIDPPAPARSCQARLCKRLWKIASLVAVVVGAVVVIVISLLKIRRSDERHASSNTNLTIPALGSTSLVSDSPIVPILSLGNPNTGVSHYGQASRIYFQAIDRSVREVTDAGHNMTKFVPSGTILSDAMNNTGLTAFSYLNGSDPHTSIFYVGRNGFIQEKRNYATWRAPGSAINNISLKATGTSGASQDTKGDPRNIWDSYRMTSAYSADFFSGAQGRLFYHSLGTNDSNVVQEMVWTQSSDSWSYGHIFPQPWPTSHLAATINSLTQTLHLFYATEDHTLQESWLNISEPGATWQIGMFFPYLLAYNNADTTAVSSQGSTFLYYFSAADRSIREINITASAGNFPKRSSEIWYDTTTFPVVAYPALGTGGNGVSLYQPLAAAVLDLPEKDPQISVFWGERNTAPDSGYAVLKTVSRAGGGEWASSTYGDGPGQVMLPLGDP